MPSEDRARPRRPLHRRLERPQRDHRQRDRRCPARPSSDGDERLQLSDASGAEPHLGGGRTSGPRRHRRLRDPELSVQHLPLRSSLSRLLRAPPDAVRRLPEHGRPRPRATARADLHPRHGGMAGRRSPSTSGGTRVRHRATSASRFDGAPLRRSPRPRRRARHPAADARRRSQRRHHPQARGPPARRVRLRRSGRAPGRGDAAVYFRLFALAPDGSAHHALLATAPHVLRSSKPRLEQAALDASGGFVGNAAPLTYERGLLGKPLWDGGDGTAERRYLETRAPSTVRQTSRVNDFAIDRTACGAAAHLSALSATRPSHLWYGYLDPSLPCHDPALASRLRRVPGRRSCDSPTARSATWSRRPRKDTIVAVGGDHGVMGVDRELRPNVVFKQAAS